MNLSDIPLLEVADNQQGINSVRPSAFRHHRLINHNHSNKQIIHTN